MEEENMNMSEDMETKDILPDAAEETAAEVKGSDEEVSRTGYVEDLSSPIENVYVKDVTTEDRLISTRYQPVETKKSGSGKWIIILAAALVLTVAYSAIQTVYIYMLNTGSAGIKTYMNGSKDNDSQESKPTEKPDDVSSDKTYEPWFSLEEATVDYSDAKRLSTTDIVKKVAPSTVSIDIYKPVQGKDTATSAGSGFVITKDGYIVTNAHVVDDAAAGEATIKVKVPGVSKAYDAKVIGSDPQTDIAVIKIESEKDLSFVTLGNSDLLEPGELLVVIGNALGTLDGTVTVGVVSALDREINKDGYTIPVIQTDAAVNNGNSGGPMINSYGEVIGITNAKMVTGTSEGLGFAIPINKVKTVIESIINYGKVINRPYLGVTLALLEEGSYYGVEPGVYVTDMIEDGPGVRSGLKIGDRILTFDGVEISTPSDMIVVRDSHSVGDKVDVVIVRDGKQETIVFTIGDSGDYTDAKSISQGQGNDGQTAPTFPLPEQTEPDDGDEPEGREPGGLDIFGED